MSINRRRKNIVGKTTPVFKLREKPISKYKLKKDELLLLKGISLDLSDLELVKTLDYDLDQIENIRSSIKTKFKTNSWLTIIRKCVSLEILDGNSIIDLEVIKLAIKYSIGIARMTNTLEEKKGEEYQVGIINLINLFIEKSFIKVQKKQKNIVSDIPVLTELEKTILLMLYSEKNIEAGLNNSKELSLIQMKNTIEKLKKIFKVNNEFFLLKRALYLNIFSENFEFFSLEENKLFRLDCMEKIYKVDIRSKKIKNDEFIFIVYTHLINCFKNIEFKYLVNFKELENLRD